MYTGFGGKCVVTEWVSVARGNGRQVRGTGEEDLEELKERELRQFEDEKRKIMQEMARMEAEAEQLADVEDDELNPPPPPPGTGGT